MEFTASHTPEEIADAIQPQFKETDHDTLVTIINRYYEQDTWKSDLIFSKDSFELIQNILDSAGELPEHVPYEDLVTTQFAEKSTK